MVQLNPLFAKIPGSPLEFGRKIAKVNPGIWKKFPSPRMGPIPKIMGTLGHQCRTNQLF